VRRYLILALVLIVAGSVAARTHTIAFGKWLPVKWFVTPEKSQPMKVRSLYVDGKIREFTMGDPHDVTDRVFVVRRAFRINDTLPDDEKKVPDWKWQRGGWVAVNRDSGRVTELKLPHFDPFYSVASWYQDYVAYCGISDDGEKLYAVVAQLGQKRPVVRKEIGAAPTGDEPDSACPAPKWQKDPVRVTFAPTGIAPVSFDVRGHSADPADTDREE
jgi:hypothetical protein